MWESFWISRHRSLASLQYNQLDALISQIYFGMKLYMFWTIPLSIIRSFSLYTQQWYMSYRIVDSFRARAGWNWQTQELSETWSSILILLESCLKTRMTYTIAMCTVNNSWWWTKELSETCRVPFQNKFEKLVHLVGFITRICRDARSYEHKKKLSCMYCLPFMGLITH
jgi:hypothetical protein